jgi:hypothetical protein
MTTEDKIYPIIHRWSEWRSKWKPAGLEWISPSGKRMRWSYAESEISRRRKDMLKRIIRITKEDR